MDIKRLKYFCAVVECRSITKAAAMLHISQPPLSKRLQELEEEIGTSLFIRHAGRLEPTPTGYFLYERALVLLKNVNDLERETKQFILCQKQTLQIGLSHLFQRYFKPLILQLYKHYPQIEVGVIVSDSDHLETLLNNEVIDVALFQRPANLHQYDSIAFPAVDLVAVMHQNLLKEKALQSIQLTDLAEYPLVLLKKASKSCNGTFEIIKDYLHKNGVVPNILTHISQPEMVLDCLESGVEAVALLPRSEVNNLHLSHCRILNVLPVPQIFFPTVAKLTTSPKNEIFELIEKGLFDGH